MKALIFDPYVNTLGGGERYCMSVAEYLLSKKWSVDLFWDDNEIIPRLMDRFKLELTGLDCVGTKVDLLSFIQRFQLMTRYDFIFWLSDGSVPFLFGKKNVLHFQVPFQEINRFPLINKIKLSRVDAVVCNSQFTKKFIDKEFSIDSQVLYPPVDIDQFSPGKKENIIVAVGRFEESMQAKKQDVLVKAFTQMVDSGLKDWQLVLIGGSLDDPKKNIFLKKLKQMAKGYPVLFLVNASFASLKSYYSKAKIFWHAAGFGVEEDREPHRVEHFGITPVEAMAAGAVPVVINKGGLKEIVRRGVGERWETIEQLKEDTFALIENQKKYFSYQKKALSRSNKFSKKSFCRSLKKILNS